MTVTTTILSSTRVRVHFDARMANTVALRSPSSYQIDPVESAAPIWVHAVTVPKDDDTCVDLDITEGTDGQTYRLTLFAVKAADGTSLAGEQADFVARGNAPTIDRVEAISKNRVDVIFDENLAITEYVLDPINYTADNELTIEAVLGVEGKRVKILTSDQTPGALYTITVVGS